MKLKKFDNPNSPENLLAPWLLSNMYRHFEIGNKGTASLGKWLLAGILIFADEHNKSVEMYKWIISDEGKSFFNSRDPEGRYVLNALTELEWSINNWVNKNKVDIPNVELQKLLDKFMSKNFYMFKYPLVLN